MAKRLLNICEELLKLRSVGIAQKMSDLGDYDLEELSKSIKFLEIELVDIQLINDKTAELNRLSLRRSKSSLLNMGHQITNLTNRTAQSIGTFKSTTGINTPVGKTMTGYGSEAEFGQNMSQNQSQMIMNLNMKTGSLLDGSQTRSNVGLINKFNNQNQLPGTIVESNNSAESQEFQEYNQNLNQTEMDGQNNDFKVTKFDTQIETPGQHIEVPMPTEMDQQTQNQVLSQSPQDLHDRSNDRNDSNSNQMANSFNLGNLNATNFQNFIALLNPFTTSSVTAVTGPGANKTTESSTLTRQTRPTLLQQGHGSVPGAVSPSASAQVTKFLENSRNLFSDVKQQGRIKTSGGPGAVSVTGSQGLQQLQHRDHSQHGSSNANQGINVKSDQRNTLTVMNNNQAQERQRRHSDIHQNRRVSNNSKNLNVTNVVTGGNPNQLGFNQKTKSVKNSQNSMLVLDYDNESQWNDDVTNYNAEDGNTNMKVVKRSSSR